MFVLQVCGYEEGMSRWSRDSHDDGGRGMVSACIGL